MFDAEIPAHLAALLKALGSDPELVEGACAAAGQQTGRAAVEAVADYYRAAGYEVTVEELTALEIARKEAVGEALSEYELEAVAGGALMYYYPTFGQYFSTTPQDVTIYWSN
jgi:hypothetical protein